jgi:uncharacterized protein
MRVAELWRYPVKSLRGERLAVAEIAEDGIAGDRLAHVRQQSGRVVTSRFRPGLLGLQASLDDDGEPLIDGLPWASAAARERVRAVAGPGAELVRFAGSDHGQRFDILPLTVITTAIVEAVGVDRRRFRPNVVIAGAELVRFAGSDHGQRFDILPLTVITTAIVEAVGVDRRRFRPNVVIAGAEGLAEVEWPGLGLRAGGVLIGVRNRRTRCVMTTFDPDTLDQDPQVLRRIVQSFGGQVALDCWVAEPGRLAEGEAIELVELPAGAEPPPGNGTDAWAWNPRAWRPRVLG